DNEIAMLIGRDVRGEEETAVRDARKGLDALFDVGGIIFNRRWIDFHSERGSNSLRRAYEIVVSESLWITDERYSRQTRRNLLEHPQPFSRDGLLIQEQPRRVSARPRQTGDHAGANRIGHVREDKRDRARPRLQHFEGRRRVDEDHVGLQRDHILHQLREPLVVAAGEAQLDPDVAPLHPPELCDSLPEYCDPPLDFLIAFGVVY